MRCDVKWVEPFLPPEDDVTKSHTLFCHHLLSINACIIGYHPHGERAGGTRQMRYYPDKNPSQHCALQHVISDLWRRHKEVTGIEAPLDVQAFLQPCKACQTHFKGGKCDAVDRLRGASAEPAPAAPAGLDPIASASMPGGCGDTGGNNGENAADGSSLSSLRTSKQKRSRMPSVGESAFEGVQKGKESMSGSINVGKEVEESRPHGEIYLISGKKMNTVATDSWAEVFKKGLLECGPRTEVLLSRANEIIEYSSESSWASVFTAKSSWPPVDLSVPLQLYIKTAPAHLRGDSRKFLLDKGFWPAMQVEKQAAKRRRLHRKLPKEYITAPLGVLELTKHDSGWRLFFCCKCKACTFAHTAVWNGWRHAWGDLDYCNACGESEMRDDFYIGDCGRCELPIYNTSHSRASGKDNIVWCALCSVNYSIDFGGA